MIKRACRVGDPFFFFGYLEFGSHVIRSASLDTVLAPLHLKRVSCTKESDDRSLALICPSQCTSLNHS